MKTLSYFYPQSLAIGDLFNGILSIVALNNRDLVNKDKRIEIFVPEDRLEILKFFSYYGVTRAKDINESFLGLHVQDILPNKSSYKFWDYFSGRGLQSKDLEISYFFDGKASNLISSNDTIIFPTSSGAELVDPSVFLHLARNSGTDGDFFWNLDPHGMYRKNIPDSSNVLNLSITDLMVTILVKKPKLILQRSGICDILYHVLKKYPNTITILYNINDPIQLAWQFGAKLKIGDIELPEGFRSYHKERRINEIFYSPLDDRIYF